MEKKVSLWKSILFTICSIIVLDTFVAPAVIGVSSITIWVITAIIFFIPYGLLSAELGSTYPDDGGITSWVKRAFGEKASVLTGWMYWINVAFWMPAVFVAFARWISYAFFPDASMWVLGIVAIIMCWVIVLIGIRGIELSVIVTNIAAICKVAVLVIFGGLGIAYGIKYGIANDFSIGSFVPQLGNTTQYISAIVYNLLGFELIGSIGSQIDNPKKTIPKMTIIAGVIITLLYVFGTFGVLAATPASEIDTVDGFYYALETLCIGVFGDGAGSIILKVIVVVACLTLVSNMVSWTMGANESLIAADLDKKSKFLGHRNKKYGTADNLYLVMGILSTILLVLNFSLGEDANAIFWVILSFSFVIFLIPYLFMFPAAVKLRLTDKETERVYQVPGGKVGIWICAILCEVAVAISIFFLFKDAEGLLAYLTLIIGTILCFVTGFWLYAAGKKNKDKIEK